MYVITFNGPWLSLNAVYTQHRHQRHIVKNQYKEIFRSLLTTAQIPHLDAFKLRIEYNSRMDVDNLTGGSKVFVDIMRELGIIKEDNKHIYKGINIEPNLELKHNTYVLSIVPVEMTTKPAEKAKKSVKKS